MSKLLAVLLTASSCNAEKKSLSQLISHNLASSRAKPTCAAGERLLLDGSCETCAPNTHSSLDGRSCISTGNILSQAFSSTCASGERLMEDGSCQNCAPYTRSSDDGRSCVATTSTTCPLGERLL
jgi:hypothetical protein